MWAFRLTLRSKPYVKFKSAATLDPTTRLGLKIGPTDATPGIYYALLASDITRTRPRKAYLPGCESNIGKWDMERFERLRVCYTALQLDMSCKIEDVEFNETILEEVNDVLCSIHNTALEDTAFGVIPTAKCE